MNSIRDIVQRLNSARLQVRGLGYFRDYNGSRQVALPDDEGEWTGLTLNEDYVGYIRAAGPLTYLEDGFNSCDTRLYDVRQDCALVIWHSREQAANSIIEVAIRALGDVLMQSVSVDRQTILSEESMPENDYGLLKISFRIEYKYVGSSCPIDLCSGYFDACYDVPNCPPPPSADCADCISTDEGNALIEGTDGKLFVPPVGSSFDCNDLDNCENFTAVQALAQTALQPGDVPAQVNSDWNAVGGVAEILNKPVIPAAQIQSDWTQANNAAVDFIKNKPTIPTNNNQLTNGAGYQTAAQVTAALPVTLVAFNGSASFTGATAESLVYASPAIPSSAWKTNQVYDFRMLGKATRSASSGNIIRVYINTANILDTNQKLLHQSYMSSALLSFPNGNPFGFVKSLIKNDNTLTLDHGNSDVSINNYTGSIDSNNVQTGNLRKILIDVVFDPTVTQYILVTCETATTQITELRMLNIKEI